MQLPSVYKIITISILPVALQQFIVTYSTVLVLNKKGNTFIRIYPNSVTNNTCTIISDNPIEEITIYTMEGRKVFSRKMNNVSGTVNTPLPHLQNGVYILQLKLKDEFINEKTLIQQ